MLLTAGNWTGKGSYRSIDAAVTTSFEVEFSLQEDDGTLIKAQLEVASQAPLSFSVWIVADDCGGYSLALNGDGMSFEGTAKLDSEPHLGLLWSKTGSHAAFAVFMLRETLGLRGFARSEGAMITWEVALRPQAEAAVSGNVVAFDAGRRRR